MTFPCNFIWTGWKLRLDRKTSSSSSFSKMVFDEIRGEREILKKMLPLTWIHFLTHRFASVETSQRSKIENSVAMVTMMNWFSNRSLWKSNERFKYNKKLIYVQIITHESPEFLQWVAAYKSHHISFANLHDRVEWLKSINKLTKTSSLCGGRSRSCKCDQKSFSIERN